MFFTFHLKIKVVVKVQANLRVDCSNKVALNQVIP